MKLFYLKQVYNYLPLPKYIWLEDAWEAARLKLEYVFPDRKQTLPDAVKLILETEQFREA